MVINYGLYGLNGGLKVDLAAKAADFTKESNTFVFVKSATKLQNPLTVNRK